MATLKSVDAICIGMGWTGSILATELTKAGLNVLGFERGQFRTTDPDFMLPAVHDELKYALRYNLFQDASRETYSFRNDVRGTALPIRQFGSFLPGDGLGGAGVHWNGTTYRFLPWDFQTRSKAVARYGQQVLGADCTSQDWGITYEQLEPHYDRFEKIAAIGGKAGNLRGRTASGGNPFEGARSNDYPNPPMETNYSGALFKTAAAQLGYHPFPMPSANNTRPGYVNPEGAAFGPCVYCGFCERFSCEMSAKASPQVALLPMLLKSPRFELRTNSRVMKINLDSTRRKATGVTYLDARGREATVNADLIFVTAFALNNVHLLLLSGVGTPYDPAANAGVVGRNYAYQANTGATVFFRSGKAFNSFMGAGSMGVTFDDFNGDNFDHAPYGFIGGAGIQQNTTGARPISFHPVPKGTPRWGSAWKREVAYWYNRAFPMNAQGGVQAYRGNYLDLDPTYRNVYGEPLLRMTFDWGSHEYKQSAFMVDVHQKLARALGATSVTTGTLPAHYDITPYQSTHTTGGAIMGSDPKTSVINAYGQCWDVSNLFVPGASAFPQNAGYNPTGTVGALAYYTANAVVTRYVKQPGPLA